MFARRALMLAVACVAATIVGSDSVQASVDPRVRVGPWLLTHTTTVWSGAASQGLTFVARPGNPTSVVTRGWASVSPALARSGWTHVGSPGSWSGSIVDAYEKRHAGSKLFVITTSGGRRFEYLHRLAHGESWHNSFAAVAPHGRWFVAGEWGTMRRLLVFSMPRQGGMQRVDTLGLTSTIMLTRQVRDVQGCTFASATDLLCSTNDPNTDLFPFPRQLLDIRLANALNGRSVVGEPRLVGALPAGTLCGSAGAQGEVEGLSTASHTMTVAVNSPCSMQTQLFSFTDRRAVVADPDLPARWTVGATQWPARRERSPVTT